MDGTPVEITRRNHLLRKSFCKTISTRCRGSRISVAIIARVEDESYLRTCLIMRVEIYNAIAQRVSTCLATNFYVKYFFFQAEPKTVRTVVRNLKRKQTVGSVCVDRNVERMSVRMTITYEATFFFINPTKKKYAIHSTPDSL